MVSKYLENKIQTLICNLKKSCPILSINSQSLQSCSDHTVHFNVFLPLLYTLPQYLITVLYLCCLPMCLVQLIPYNETFYNSHCYPLPFYYLTLFLSIWIQYSQHSAMYDVNVLHICPSIKWHAFPIISSPLTPLQGSCSSH